MAHGTDRFKGRASFRHTIWKGADKISFFPFVSPVWLTSQEINHPLSRMIDLGAIKQMTSPLESSQGTTRISPLSQLGLLVTGWDGLVFFLEPKDMGY